MPRRAETHPNLSLNSDRELLVQPDLDGRVGLEELKDKVDGRKQHPAVTTTLSAGHCDAGGCVAAGWGESGSLEMDAVVVVGGGSGIRG